MSWPFTGTRPLRTAAGSSLCPWPDPARRRVREEFYKIFLVTVKCVVPTEYWDNVWKSQGCIMVNGVPQEVPRSKPEGPQAPDGFGQGNSRGTPFTMIHTRLFHAFSFFRPPKQVKRNFLHCRQTQPAPREYPKAQHSP